MFKKTHTALLVHIWDQIPRGVYLAKPSSCASATIWMTSKY